MDSLEHLQQLYDDFESRQLVQDDPDGGVSVVGLRCRTPAGLLLFDGLTLVVPPGGRLLVMVCYSCRVAMWMEGGFTAVCLAVCVCVCVCVCRRDKCVWLCLCV